MCSGRHPSRPGGHHPGLDAQQHGDVVAHAPVALLAASEDFIHQALVAVVLTTPLADRYALVLQPFLGLFWGAEFFHRMV